MRNDKRADEMLAMVMGGDTLQKIADRYGLTRQRIYTITERRKWQMYEQFKQSLLLLNLSPSEYEERIKDYIKSHKL